MQYRILTGSRSTLETLVEGYINEGWSLVGGVSSGESGWFYQAVTRDLR